MITLDNLTLMLETSGFSKDERTGLYEKRFPQVGCTVGVDLEKKEIVYPEDAGFVVNDRTTCNFNANENFVVLECVCRLLEKGYRPEHIELERRWTLGHEQKSGKADICVKTADGNEMLCIIECKTFGGEYEAELKNLVNDGGQLFSYWQQEKSTEWLVLYTSNYEDERIVYQTTSIDCSDDANIVFMAEKDGDIRLFKDAYSAADLHQVWAETYEGATHDDILFRDDTVAYEIGVKPLRKRDLVDFKTDDKIVNRFEEILRHNNVSDKENAFNRLIALFICKLVDEMSKADDDEVEFQYKVGTDTYESLQDRLQRLHKQGMDEFMKEEIFYVANDYAEKVIQQYTGQKRAKLIEELNQTLRILKFYTNNDFAFKDVHNEELFYQNGKILVEVVQLFQGYRIIDSKDLQLLGDLFEQLLNKGFKQNEGQFFTPIPIARFMWNSLPLNQIVSDGKSTTYPKVIDYACGAGHFLTEGYEAIKDAIIETGLSYEEGWVRSGLYGIEKDYRLARVSKISLFMHGAGEGNIVFGDGLENYPDKGIEPSSFDILVANPPYAVSAFKPHLKLKNNELDVLECITESGSEIETAFVERIAQLLKPNGVAAVILPSTILTKDGGSFITARESILKSFQIKAIASMGSRTFGATGTSTVIMFLKKYDEPPKRVDLIQDSIQAIFEMRDLADWEDNEILKDYLSHINVDAADYASLVKRDKPRAYWQTIEHFEPYIRAFNESSELKSKEKQVGFKNLSEPEREAWRMERLYSFMQEREREKLLYFALVYKQEMVVITSPTESKAQEELLGYKWSNRKGAEGIQIIEPGGSLYTEGARLAEDNLAWVVRSAFEGIAGDNQELSGYYHRMAAKDTLNFATADFTKAIRIAKQAYKPRSYRNGIELSTLRKVAPFVAASAKANDIHTETYVTTDTMLKDKMGVRPFVGTPTATNGTKYAENDILVSNIRPYLKKIWKADKSGVCSNDVMVFRSSDPDRITPEYLYFLLQQDDFFDYSMSTAGGMKMPRGDKDLLLNYKIPIVSINEQEKFCSALGDIRREQQRYLEQASKEETSMASCFETLCGDPLENEHDWPLMSLGELYRVTSSKRIYAKDQTRKGIPFLRVADIAKLAQTGTVEPSLFIAETTFHDLLKSKLVPSKDDLLITARGTLGKCYRVTEDDAFYFQDGMVTWLSQTKKSPLPAVVEALFANERFLNYLIAQTGGANVAYLTIDFLSSLKIPLPPKNIQEALSGAFEDHKKSLYEAMRSFEQAKISSERIIAPLLLSD